MIQSGSVCCVYLFGQYDISETANRVLSLVAIVYTFLKDLSLELYSYQNKTVTRQRIYLPGKWIPSFFIM